MCIRDSACSHETGRSDRPSVTVKSAREATRGTTQGERYAVDVVGIRNGQEKAQTTSYKSQGARFIFGERVVIAIEVTQFVARKRMGCVCITVSYTHLTLPTSDL